MSAADGGARQAFGPPVASGDKLCFVCNFSEGTIAILLNDLNLGVAFVFQRDGRSSSSDSQRHEAAGRGATQSRNSSESSLRSDLEPLFPVVLFGASGDSVKFASPRMQPPQHR